MTLLIKKYKNRRLYDTDKSQYVTVDDLHQYVVDGLAFKVEDSESKEDITSTILMQILVEMEGGPSKFLAPEVLRQLICMAHHPMHQSIKELFGQMVASIEQQTHLNPYLNNMTKATEAWRQQMKELSSHWQDLFGK